MSSASFCARRPRCLSAAETTDRVKTFRAGEAPDPGAAARVLRASRELPHSALLPPGRGTQGTSTRALRAGMEDRDGMSQRDEFITWVQTVLTEAEVAIHNGEASQRRAIWSRNDPVTVLGAWRSAAGQAELNALFSHLAESFSDCTSYELELLEAEVLGDAAYTVGFEHTSASLNGVPTSYTLRATQIYRREEGEWKVAHRHGSAPPS